MKKKPVKDHLSHTSEYFSILYKFSQEFLCKT